jgi:uncharacterized protein
MELRRFADPAAFSARAVPFLLAREGAHCLPLGLIATLVHEPGRYPQAPYLATVEASGAVVAVAVRTPPHNVVLSHVADGGALDPLVADLHREYGTLPGVLGPTPHARDFAARWSRLVGQPHERFMAQRIYELTRVRPVTGVPGELRPVADADRPIAYEWVAAFTAEAEGVAEPAYAREIVDSRLGGATAGLALWWHDGRPVSLAGHGGPTPTGIRIGPVYSPPELRGRGYASAAVAALSQRLLDAGRRACFLFTDLANPTANHIYRAIGYEAVCDSEVYRFDSTG